MWGVCGEEINIFPTSSQELSHIVPSPTSYLQIPHWRSFDKMWGGCGEDVAKKLILTQHVPYVGKMWSGHNVERMLTLFDCV